MNNRLLLLCLFWGGLCSGAWSQNISWTLLEDGLEWGEFQATPDPVVNDGIVSVLRICPDHFDFEFGLASLTGSGRRTAREWCEAENFVAAVNAGMFGMDGRTNVGFLKSGDHLNNPRENKDNTIICFDPGESGLPGFQIVDRTCQDWPSLKEAYGSCVQGIRMIDCQGKNVWSQQPRIWSMVVLGMDEEGNALFIFTRSPLSVHDFIDVLQHAPLRLRRAQYLEGGPEASLYVHSRKWQRNLFGSYETGFFESDGNDRPWPIPNVIGIRRKQRPGSN